MKLLTTILVTLLLLSTSTYTAKVVRVSDGDTTTLLTDNKEQIRIRLEGMVKVEIPNLYNKKCIFQSWAGVLFKGGFSHRFLCSIGQESFLKSASVLTIYRFTALKLEYERYNI
jgi:hypothetical protein